MKWFAFNFTIDNLSTDEIQDILTSLKHKKIYHRLKNGNIINLEEDDELKEFSNLLSDLEIDTHNLSSNL